MIPLPQEVCLEYFDKQGEDPIFVDDMYEEP